MRTLVSLLVVAVLLALPAAAQADTLTSSPRYTTPNGTVCKVIVVNDLAWEGYFIRHGFWRNYNECGEDFTGFGWQSLGVNIYLGGDACFYTERGGDWTSWHYWYTACQGGGWYVSRAVTGFNLKSGHQWLLSDGTHQIGTNRTAVVSGGRRHISIYHNNAACVGC